MMQGFCGWLGFPGQHEEQSKAALSAMVGAPADPGAMHVRPDAALYAGPNASSLEAENILVALAGDPRIEGMPSGMTPAQRVLALWREHGGGLFEHLHGHFALAILDRATQRALLAVDRIGIGRLCLAQAADGIVFGVTCDSVARHPAVAREIDPQGIFNYLYAHMVPAPGSVYRGVEKLLPAQYALFQNGRTSRAFYWEAAWEDGETANFQQASDTLHSLLDQCVRDAIDTRPIGTFLSGGTDSSTVSGMLTRIAGKPAETFSIGFAAEGFDEIEYARLANRHFGMHGHEYYVTPDDVVQAIPLIAATYDEPFGNASAVPTYFCALRAKQAGIEVMLAGDGGDEIFGGNTRYAKQMVFEAYGRLPGALRRGFIEPLLATLPGTEALMPLRKARRYVEQAKTPLPDRLESYNLLHRHALEATFTPEFLRAVTPDQPLELAREVYFRTRARSPINRMLHLDWKQTLADSDLVKVGRMCEAAGVAVRYPLLDERMVAFAAGLPPSYKVRGQKLRWFFKTALQDFLPREILTKSKHGFGLPFGLWLKDHPALFDMAQDKLRAFRSRGFLQESYIDRLLQAHQTEHATYYGVMIWVVLMLEQWLQHHIDQRP